MSVHWPAPDKVAREHGVDAVPADEMVSCSQRDTAETYGLILLGCAVLFGAAAIIGLTSWAAHGLALLAQWSI